MLVADFETTVYDGQTDTQVWSAAWAELYKDEVFVLGNIHSYMQTMIQYKQNIIIWFHNLKFDGTFILTYLLHHDYTFTTKPRKDMVPRSFNCLISSKRQFYSITIKTSYGFIEFRDSLKLVPFSLKAAAKAFETEHQKLDMTYKGYRYPDCPISPDELAYIKNDVLALKEIMEHMVSEGHHRLTIGSCALHEFKTKYDKSEYESLFPELEILPSPTDADITQESYIRRFYKGAWCYVGRSGHQLSGRTFDINSLYPFVMHSQSGNYYPIGHPQFFYGSIPDICNREDIVWFVHIRAKFELKEGYLPTIQIKKSFLYNPREWLTTSRIKFRGQYYDYLDKNGERYYAYPELYLTMKDYELFLKHYNVTDLQVIDGCYFNAIRGIFDDYINKWKSLKENAPNKVQRTISKLFQNALYGKFSTSTDSSYEEPCLDEEGILSFLPHTEFKKKAGYIPIGAMITSNARYYTITHAQENYDLFCYADTDSLHLLEGDFKDLDIHPTRLGAWKCETHWSSAIFIRAKTYAEFIRIKDEENVYPHWEITCAGMPERCKKIFLAEHPITDFKYGLKIRGKLVPKIIQGGTILIERDFTLRR